jgi:DNA mismatch repair protein MutS
LAGVPQPVVRRAREILRNLERDEYGRDGLPRRARRRAARERGAPGQISLFSLGEEQPARETASDRAAAEVLAELRLRDANAMTPIDALRLLDDWQRRLRAAEAEDDDNEPGR